MFWLEKPQCFQTLLFFRKGLKLDFVLSIFALYGRKQVVKFMIALLYIAVLLLSFSCTFLMCQSTYTRAENGVGEALAAEFGLNCRSNVLEGNRK